MPVIKRIAGKCNLVHAVLSSYRHVVGQHLIDVAGAPPNTIVVAIGHSPQDTLLDAKSRASKYLDSVGRI